MSARKKTVEARKLGPEDLAKLAEGLQSVHRDATPVYRGNERLPILSIGSPALGRFSIHAIALTQQCSANRNLETTTPGALRIKKNETMPGLIVMVPVLKYEKNETDLYQLRWYRGNNAASINLLALLQPRNQASPKGYVNEVPVSLEELPGNGWVLLLHMEDAEMRPVDSTDLEEETAAAADHAADE